MDRNKFIVFILMFMIVADSSNASFVWNFQKSIHVARKDSSTEAQIAPLPSSVSGGKESNPSSIDAGKTGKEKPKDPHVTSNTSNLDPKGSNNNNKTGSESTPIDKQTDQGKNHKGKEKGDKTTNSQLGTNERCEGSPRRCRDKKTMLACIQSFENGSKELVFLVQNEGERNLNVTLTIPASEDNALPIYEIPKYQTEKINISLPDGKITKIVLNAGNGDCILHMDPSASEGNFFQKLSFYSKQVTPIYGAYFLFLVALIFGGTWACCKLRKRRLQGGVPYQELEMGLPESAAAVNVDTAEGWDQHWDDDWDEENAVKSPGGRHVGSISANGLTSRSSKRDGWEIDWED